LEALALGTAVITSKVGIASEIDNSTADFQVIERHPENFIEALKKLQYINLEDSNMASFNQYLERALQEQIIPQSITNTNQDFPKFRMGAILRTQLMWRLRYLKKLSKG
jgi:glycosyltransferase involved in cell wall biosynthesis